MVWSGADSADTTNWSDGLNWSGNLRPARRTPLVQHQRDVRWPGLRPVENIVSATRQLARSMYAPTNGFRNTLIAPGVTLTISNATVTSSLLSGTQTDAGGDTTVYNTVIGTGGTLVINSTNVGSAMFDPAKQRHSGTHRSTVDLSELDTFNATVGRMLIAVQGPLNAVAGQVSFPILPVPAGTLMLARTNIVRTTQTGLILGGQDGGNGSGQGGAASISGPAIVLGDGASNGGQGVMQLGQTNAMFADTICVPRQKSIGNVLSFNPAFASPTLFMRGVTSNRVMRLAVADDGNLSTSTTGASAVIGSVDLSGGTSDLMIDTFVIANGQTGNGTAPITGTFTLGAGIMDVNTVNVGYQNTANAAEVTQGTLQHYCRAAISWCIIRLCSVARSAAASRRRARCDRSAPARSRSPTGSWTKRQRHERHQFDRRRDNGRHHRYSFRADWLALVGDTTLNLAVNGSAAPVVMLHLGDHEQHQQHHQRHCHLRRSPGWLRKSR